MHLRAPCGIREDDPERRTDVFQARMRPPCRDALEMLLIEIAWPPGDFRHMAREIDDMLAGATAGLDHIAGFAGEETLQH